MPLILIAGSRGKNDVGAQSHMVDKRYPQSLMRAGLESVLATGEITDISPFAGLLLAGGPDINPELYGIDDPALIHPSVSIDDERDALEWKLMRAFIRAEKPIFGICRGLQVINVYFGGTLWQDLPSEKGVNHMNVTHKIRHLPGSPINFGQDVQTVNSTHHQAVKTLGFQLVSDAENEEGFCEALHHPSLPIWAVQWHPERSSGDDIPDGQDNMLPLFKFFAAKCGIGQG